MLRLKEAALSATMLLALAACGSTDTQRTTTGAAGGAVAGAVVGGPVGAVVGGAGGAVAGHTMDESLGTKTDRWTNEAAESVDRDTSGRTASGHTSAMSRDNVRNVQQALNDNGSHLDVDGRWGPATRAALEDFQRSHDLKPSGRLDSATRHALNLDQPRTGAGTSGRTRTDPTAGQSSGR
ncbi:peptidoglycan-binding domain-containing protein [Azospirillum sp. TSO22-1]|uniref:peptidoglycan-binding domain-containing protein n=1 Tax=Azospirillum sp. TSO22-1 TaxID=716789 RepID=UPI000D650E6A|nr:peptidoglycan-binding domain-containing protein [Azospirillum sp. TSO22-1]